MESRAKAFGHPIHPMLIVFPLGLLATAVIFDVLYLAFENTTFSVVAYWLMISGVVGGLLSAIFGFIDWLAIPGGTRAKGVGLVHGAGNVLVTTLFALSWYLRMGTPDHVPGTGALVMSFAGVLLSLFTGWLGGELVYRLSVAVDRGAHLNASSSLSGQPASAPYGSEAGLGQAIPATGREEDEEDRERY